MAAVVTFTVSGQSFELYPEVIDLNPELIGGPLRRAVGGKAYRKIIGERQAFNLKWAYLTADEKALVDLLWQFAKQGTVAISCPDPLISGNFILINKTKDFSLLEGSSNAWEGSISFGEE